MNRWHNSDIIRTHRDYFRRQYDYRDVIKQFYDAGCRNLQLDDCTWGAIVGDAAKQRYKSLGIDLKEVKEQLLRVNNLALEDKPEDMVINSHICRGNYHSTYFTSINVQNGGIFLEVLLLFPR